MSKILAVLFIVMAACQSATGQTTAFTGSWCTETIGTAMRLYKPRSSLMQSAFGLEIFPDGSVRQSHPGHVFVVYTSRITDCIQGVNTLHFIRQHTSGTISVESYKIISSSVTEICLERMAAQ